MSEGQATPRSVCGCARCSGRWPGSFFNSSDGEVIACGGAMPISSSTVGAMLDRPPLDDSCQLSSGLNWL